MSKLIILRGVSGCGKSTWAESQMGNPVIVSRDRIRLALWKSNDQDYYQVSKDELSFKERMVSEVQDATIVAGLRSGHDVIVDNTNVEWKYVKALAKLAFAENAPVEIKTFDVSLSTAQQRNKARALLGGREVPEEIIRDQHQRLQGSKNYTLDIPQPPVPYTGTPGKPMAFMVDIDGTLAHMNGKRGPFEWHKVGLDEPDEVVIDVVNNLADDHTPYNVIVMSGRDESCRAETEKWLTGLLPFDELFMRSEKDMRSDNIVKAELFDTHVRDNYDVKFVIDDRWQVCRMWLTMGLKVFNVSGLDRGEF